jgi:hypothetical protein
MRPRLSVPKPSRRENGADDPNRPFALLNSKSQFVDGGSKRVLFDLE